MRDNIISENKMNFSWNLIFYSMGAGVILLFQNGLINKFILPKTTLFYTFCLISIPLLAWGWERMNFPRKSFLILLLITACSGFVTAFFSTDRALSFWGTYGRRDGILTFLFYLFLAFLASSVPIEKKFMRKFLILSILCGSLSSLYGVGQFLGFDFILGLTERERIRPIGTIGGVNASAGFLALLFPGVFALALGLEKKWRTILFSMAGSIFFLGLLLSYCRGAWLAALCGSFCILIFYFHFNRKKKLKNLVFFILFLLPMPMIHGKLLNIAPGEKLVNPDLQAISESSLGERFASTVNVKDSTIKSRGELWKISFQIWKEYPLVGSGPETFSYFHGRMRGPQETLKYGSGATAKHAHNIVLHYLSTRGLVGTLPVVLLWLFTLLWGFSLIRNNNLETNQKNEIQICFSILVSTLIFSLTNVHTTPGYVYLWMMVGFLWNPSICNKNQVWDLPKKVGSINPGKRVLIGVFISIFLGLYLFRPILADALFVEAITTSDSKIKEKIDKYNTALKVFPDDRVYAENFVIWLNSLPTEIQQKHKCLDLALNICEENLKFPLENDNYLYLQSRSLYLLSQETTNLDYLERAENNMEYLLDQIPYHLDGILLMVQIQIQQKDFSEGLKWIDKGLKWSGLDFVKERLGEKTIKSEHLRDCKIILYLSRLKGNILVKLGRNSEAEKVFNEILTASPEDGLTWYNLGTLLAQSGAHYEAEKALEKTLEILPDHAPARNNLEVVKKMLENE